MLEGLNLGDRKIKLNWRILVINEKGNKRIHEGVKELNPPKFWNDCIWDLLCAKMKEKMHWGWNWFLNCGNEWKWKMTQGNVEVECSQWKIAQGNVEGECSHSYPNNILTIIPQVL